MVCLQQPGHQRDLPGVRWLGCLLGLVQENQQLTPTGGTTLSGTPFQILGDFTITSGTLTVVLSDTANGTVVADAMLVQPLATPTVDLNWTGGSLTGPTTLAVGSSFTLSRTYTISGATAPSSFVISYYSSTSSTFSGSAVLLGSETISVGLDNGHVQRHQPELPIRSGRHLLPVRRAQRHLCLRRDQRCQQRHGGDTSSVTVSGARDRQ